MNNHRVRQDKGSEQTDYIFYFYLISDMSKSLYKIFSSCVWQTGRHIFSFKKCFFNIKEKHSDYGRG